MSGANICYNCEHPCHFKRDCPQLRPRNEVEQGTVSQIVNQPKQGTGTGDASSAGRQRGQVGRPRQ